MFLLVGLFGRTSSSLALKGKSNPSPSTVVHSSPNRRNHPIGLLHLSSSEMSGLLRARRSPPVSGYPYPPEFRPKKESDADDDPRDKSYFRFGRNFMRFGRRNGEPPTGGSGNDGAVLCLPVAEGRIPREEGMKTAEAGEREREREPEEKEELRLGEEEEKEGIVSGGGKRFMRFGRDNTQYDYNGKPFMRFGKRFMRFGRRRRGREMGSSPDPNFSLSPSLSPRLLLSRAEDAVGDREIVCFRIDEREMADDGRLKRFMRFGRSSSPVGLLSMATAGNVDSDSTTSYQRFMRFGRSRLGNSASTSFQLDADDVTDDVNKDPETGSEDQTGEKEPDTELSKKFMRFGKRESSS